MIVDREIRENEAPRGRRKHAAMMAFLSHFQSRSFGPLDPIETFLPVREQALTGNTRDDSAGHDQSAEPRCNQVYMTACEGERLPVASICPATFPSKSRGTVKLGLREGLDLGN